MSPALLLTLAALGSPSFTEDPAALSYDGTEVRRSDYENWLLQRRGKELARDFVLCLATRWELERLGLAVDPERVRGAVEADFQKRIDGAFQGERERFLAELDEAGRTLDGRIVERSIELERDLGLAAIAQVLRTVEDGDVHAEWERRYGPQGRRIDARLIHLHLEVDGAPGETREEGRARREAAKERLLEETLALRERILDGEDFSRLARLHSEDASSAGRGGVPPRPFDPAQWPSGVRTQLSSLAQGELSQPVFARGGYWLVLAADVHVTPLEDVAAALRTELLEREAGSREVAETLARITQESTFELTPALVDPVAPPDAVVIRVGDREVTRHEYGRWLRRYRGELSAARFVEERRIEEAAAEAGIRATEEDVLARLDEDIQRDIELFHRGDRDDWLADLRASGRTEAEYRERALPRTRLDLLVDELLRRERDPDERELRQAWERTYGPGGRKTALRWIRLDLPMPPQEALDSKEEFDRWRERAGIELAEEGADLHRRILGGEDFATLAEKHSDDPVTRPRGGAPTEDFRFEMLPDELARAVEALASGGLTEPIVWQDSIWLIELIGRQETPFEAVRDRLAQEIRSRRAFPTELAAKKLALTRGVQIVRAASLLE